MNELGYWQFVNAILNTKSIYHAITDKLQTKSPEGGKAMPLADAFGISNHMLGSSSKTCNIICK